MRLDLTPWARRDIDHVVQEILLTMEPRKGTVHIGRGLRDWRAVATFNGWVLADVRSDSALKVAEKLIETMTPAADAEPVTFDAEDDPSEQADGMTQAKARDDLRDGVAHFQWHGHDIEVEVS